MKDKNGMVRCKICYIVDNNDCDCYYRVGGYEAYQHISKVLDLVSAIRKEKDEVLKRKGERK